uniref:Reverse transcriptase domain-containing protein n=1 Tax=Tanacetum cinerariifolium TaxID=118510 RepID=A0A6L2LFE4_TANCI|nr:reverse transcriptase domain-containing protein [Tanacetum cinerariifolium]
MADQRTMAELLRAPTEGYVKAIVVPPILAEQFELKHSLINMMTSDQFFGLEKDNPRDHIRWFNKITSTIKYKDVPNSAIKLMLFPFSLVGRFDESFHEAWDRYKDLLCACPHHGFTELHQLDTFYNALNPTDQDSLNSAAGGNLLERRTQYVLTIIENKSKVTNSRNKSVVSKVKSYDANSNSSSHIARLTHVVNQQTSVVTTAMTAIPKQFQATPPPASVKSVEEIFVTCSGAHLYYQCLAASGNTFLELRDNIQRYVAAVAVNYNQGNFVYHPSGSGSLPSNTVANPKGELKAITTRSGIVLDGPSVPIPRSIINLEEDERIEETLTDQDLAEETSRTVKHTFNENCSAVILKKLPEKLGDPGKFIISCGFSKLKCKALSDLGASINLITLSVWKKLGLPELISTRMTLELANRAICTPAGIARDVFVPVEKFTFPVDFVIVDYKSDPRVPLILVIPFLRTAHALIDVHEEEMILRDGDERLTLNMRHDTSSYFNQPQKESINLINVFNNSNEDFLEDLFSTNQPSGNPTFSSHPELTSPNLADLNDNSDIENVYDDPLDSKGEKIKESKLLIDELDLPYDFFLPFEYDSIPSEDFSNVDAFPSANNEDKVFNPGILIQENLFKVITHVAPEKKNKKLARSHASLMIEDFDHPFYEIPFFKEVPSSKIILLISSENEKKVFKPASLGLRPGEAFVLLRIYCESRGSDHLAKWAESSALMTWSVSPGMTRIENTQAMIKDGLSPFPQTVCLSQPLLSLEFKQLLGENSAHTATISPIEETLSQTEREKDDMITEEIMSKTDDVEKEHEHVPEDTKPISITIHTTLKSDKGNDIARDTDESPQKLVKASTKVRPDPDTLVLIPFKINATKAEVDPKSLQSSKGGQEFIKKLDAEMKVLKREHLEKLTKAKELRKKRIDQYRWTTTSRCKPKTITDILIHPNTKPVAITVYRGND